MCKLAPNVRKIACMVLQINITRRIFLTAVLLILLSVLTLVAPAQSSATTAPSDTWTIRTGAIDPSNYYGVTVANGMIGLVSSSDPFRAKDVVLNGAFDLYGRGRVSNILKTFNFVNLYLDIDGARIDNFR